MYGNTTLKCPSSNAEEIGKEFQQESFDLRGETASKQASHFLPCFVIEVESEYAVKEKMDITA